MPSFQTCACVGVSWLVAGIAGAAAMTGAVGVWCASTSRRRARALAEQLSGAYRAREAQTRLMVESIADHAIFTLDADRRVTSWNAGCERMLGVDEGDILGRPVSELLLLSADEEAGRSEDGLNGRHFHEGWHDRRNGGRFWCALAIAPLQADSMSEPGYVVILRDDTERRQAMDALAHTSAELEQRTVELGRFNRLAFGRELRMIELKRMVNERSAALGMTPPFDLSFAEHFGDVGASEERA